MKKAVTIPDLGPQYVPLQDVDRLFNPITTYLNKTIEPFVFDTRGKQTQIADATKEGIKTLSKLFTDSVSTII